MGRHKDVLIIPRYLVALRFIELPSVDTNEVSNMAEFQVLKELPYTKEEIVASYRNLGSYKKGFSYIMLAIMKRQLLEDLIKERKANPENIRLETETLYLYLLNRGIVKQDKLNLVLDVHKEHSEIIIIDKIKPVFSRGFSHREDFSEEINRSLFLYKRDKDYKEAEEIFVTHDSNLNIENIKSSIKSLFSNSVKFYEYEKDLSELDFVLEIDFLPKEYINKKLKEENTKQVFLTYFLLFVAMVMLASFFILKVHQKNKTIYMLMEKTSKIQKDIDELDIFLKKTDMLKSKKAEGEMMINVLKESCELAPKEVSLLGLNYDGEGMLYCKGAAINMSSVFDFIKTLEKSKYFKKVEVKYATKKEAGSHEFADFNIACQVK